MLKESACSEGNAGSIPGSGQSPRAGNGKLLLAWRIPWTKEPGGLHTVHGVTKSWTQLRD